MQEDSAAANWHCAAANQRIQKIVEAMALLGNVGPANAALCDSETGRKSDLAPHSTAADGSPENLSGKDSVKPVRRLDAVDNKPNSEHLAVVVAGSSMVAGASPDSLVHAAAKDTSDADDSCLPLDTAAAAGTTAVGDCRGRVHLGAYLGDGLVTIH